MSKGLTNPLASVIAAARKGLPQTTGATAQAEALRSRPRVHVVLADVSGSMAEPAGRRRKVDVLAEALQGVPAGSRLVAFCDVVIPLASPSQMPSPAGSTALHLALDHCRQIGATDILVISDGHPDNEAAALAIAEAMDARIDVIYCGPETDRAGLAFMRRLARGGGAAHRHSFDQAPRLTEAVRRLALPPAGTK